MNNRMLWATLTLATTMGCGHKPDWHHGAGGAGGAGGSAGSDEQCPVVVADADCDKTQRPFVFVHGTFGSGDNIAHVASLFGSNGYCQDRFIAIEYNSLGESPGENGKLDAAIDAILQATGATQVELAGHSQGTLHCMRYLADPAHAAKVAHYINFSGGGTVPNDVPTLSLSSENDIGGTTHHATGTNVTTYTLKDEDHFAVASSTNSFVQVYKYLRGEEPRYTEIQCGEPMITIEGIAESFTDNVPVVGHAEIRELGPEPRVAGTLVLDNMADSTGHFGPIQLKRNVPYEIKGFDSQGKLVGYQYFSPFKRSNRLVRLLVPSGNPVVAQATTDHFVRTPEQVNVVARSAAGAFRQDLGDSFKIDGNEILTPENAGKSASVVGLFLYDANSNGQSDLGVAFSAPFVVGSDVFIGASDPEFVDLDYNGTNIRISNWPASDALVSVMFQ